MNLSNLNVYLWFSLTYNSLGQDRMMKKSSISSQNSFHYCVVSSFPYNSPLFIYRQKVLQIKWLEIVIFKVYRRKRKKKDIASFISFPLYSHPQLFHPFKLRVFLSVPNRMETTWRVPVSALPGTLFYS